VGVVDATGGREISRRMVSELASQGAFFGVSALLFAVSAAVTIVWCASMSAMGEILGKSAKHLRSAGRPARSRGCKSLTMKE
jgi:hypothetical protein